MSKVDMVFSRVRQVNENIDSDFKCPKDANNELSDIIHAGIHDVRSPLSVIKPYISFLKRIEDKDKRDAILDMMDLSVAKIEKIIKGLVNYTDVLLLESPDSEEFYFENILDEIKMDLNESIQETGTVILSDFSISPHINFPVSHFKTILFHLLDNAVKYRHSDRLPIIRIYTQRTKYNTILTFIDNGEGMDLENCKDELTKPFTKLKKNNNGVGLGLATVKALISKNGGEIYIKSNSGGTTIQLILAN